MSGKKRLVVGLAIAALVVSGVVAWALMQDSKPSTVVSKVGKHYLLPSEEPTVATVEDKTKLSSEFLRAAENGDKLLLFKDAKKVILYRPSIDRIIEVGPISIAETNAPATE